LTKPFSYVVLHAHLRALARRGAHGGEDEPSVLRCGDLVLDHGNIVVRAVTMR